MEKKIIYVTTMRFPTEKAHGISTVKICEAFSDLGFFVTVIAPRLWGRDGGDPYGFYGVKKNFDIVKTFCIDLMPFGIFEKAAFFIQSVTFSLFSIPFIYYKFGRNIKNYVFFSHDYIPLYFMSFLPVKIFYDIHHFPGNNFMYRRVMKRSFGFSVQTKWKVGELSDRFGIPKEKIIYWPNGTDVERFAVSVSKETARKELGVPADKNIVMYTGQLFDWKGVDSLIRSVDLLPKNTLIYLVGGAEKDVVNCKKEIKEANDKRIIYIGFQPHSKMPLWLKAADVLVLPNTGKQKVSLYYTSPMKLFEYMAVGRPIVSSAVPSIMEILNKDNSVLVRPDEPKAFADGVKKIASDRKFAEDIAKRAAEDSKKYTWPARARKIIDYFESHA